MKGTLCFLQLGMHIGQLSQKFKLLRNCEFDRLIIISTLSLTCELRPPLINGSQYVGYLIFEMAETRFEQSTTCFDIMLNCQYPKSLSA